MVINFTVIKRYSNFLFEFLINNLFIYSCQIKSIRICIHSSIPHHQYLFIYSNTSKKYFADPCIGPTGKRKCRPSSSLLCHFSNILAQPPVIRVIGSGRKALIGVAQEFRDVIHATRAPVEETRENRSAV